VVLYEVITGTVPFQKPNYNALMHAIINEDPTSSVERGAGDKSLWQVIQRGLRRQREDRFQSATELGEAMALWLYEHGIKEDLSGNSIRAVWLDAAFANEVRDGRSARPATSDSSSASRHDQSRAPTTSAPTTGAGTLPTLPPRATSRKRSVAYLIVPGLALALVGLIALLVLPSSAERSTASALPAAAAAKLIASAPLAPPAPQGSVEVAPESLPAPRPSSSAVAKPRARPVAARKKEHDFGF
jgi:serine/threonine-protein kinase